MNLSVDEKCIAICDAQDGRPCEELRNKTRDKPNMHMLLLHNFGWCKKCVCVCFDGK